MVKSSTTPTYDEKDLEERAPLSQVQIDKREAIAKRWGTTWEGVATGHTTISQDKIDALRKLRDAFLKNKEYKANARIMYLNMS
ncbi:hypothetical protein P3T76_011927 [Phytophthora citrophthora]|uniref:RxLR effector protein n=1 Tax=Phytophthora citrophthora TaxID=4793 RepID=A0AAD9LEM5_9STRA|nr:hypothetical protein P3T76_011927 [Phytophthora citrophthora]